MEEVIDQKPSGQLFLMDLNIKYSSGLFGHFSVSFYPLAPGQEHRENTRIFHCASVRVYFLCLLDQGTGISMEYSLVSCQGKFDSVCVCMVCVLWCPLDGCDALIGQRGNTIVQTQSVCTVPVYTQQWVQRSHE